MVASLNTYFPEQRHMLYKTTIRRDRFLPDYSPGEVIVTPGSRVSLGDIVVRGAAPAPFVLIDAAKFFELKHNDALYDLLEVQVGEHISAGEVLAGRGGRRGKRLFSPVIGRVVEIAEGYIILQELTPQLEIEAGLNGAVVNVEKNHGVTVEAYGAVLQGVWGNGRRSIGTVQFEPSEGLENIFGDMLDTQYHGALIVTRRPLRELSFQVIDEQGFRGIIAPSMEPRLIERALHSSTAILLTEGFGSRRISTSVAQFLEDLEGRQATLDAILPAPLESRRPEVLITVPLEPGERPPPPNLSRVLDFGQEVRLTRGDLAGMIGRIVDLPNEPVSLDNGLRVACALVEVVTGEKAFVPLANIEVSGS